MQKVKLGDIAEYINGYPFKPTDWSERGYPIIRIQDLTGSDYQTNKFNGKVDSRYEVNDGDILISWSATLGIYIWNRGKAYLNQHIFKVILNTDIVDKWYFYYQVDNLLKGAQSEAHGATMKHLTKGVFNNLPFILPTMVKQKNIANYFCLIDNIIEKRNQQLAKLDELIKSKFIEIFGNYINTQYPIIQIADICEFIKDGTHQTPTYTEDSSNGYKFLSSKDVTSGYIDWSKIKYIPAELHNELYAKVAPQKGDILLAKNGTTGVCAIVDTDEVFDIYVSLALLRLKKDCNIKYIWSAINMPSTKEQFNASLKGIGVPNLHLGEIKKTKIVFPPLDLQNQFAKFVENVEGVKIKVKQSLAQLEVLKKSLMQKYFG